MRYSNNQANSSHSLDVIVYRYYAKQQLEDKLKERRERLAKKRAEEEQQRLAELGLAQGESSLADLMRRERGAARPAIFRSPSSAGGSPSHTRL